MKKTIKTYDEVYAIAKAYAEKVAERYGLTNKTESKNDFWGDYGKPVIVWGNDDKSIKVELRTRFENPRIDVHIGEDYAGVEIGRGSRKTGSKDKYGYDEYEYDKVYRPREMQAWGENGLKIVSLMWKALSTLIHKPANGYIEK